MGHKKEDIFNIGMELFSTKGFKETNISEIAKMAGIGVGTFYNYYSSKENLFLEIYISENEKLKKRILESLNLNDDPVNLVKKAMTQNISAMNSNPILKEWYNRDVFNKLEQYFQKQGGVEGFNADFVYSFGVELIKKWKGEGKIRDDINDELILAFFHALLFLDIHKKEIGIHHFPPLIDYLAEFIMKGLTDCQ